jgi:hypothetical protein
MTKRFKVWRVELMEIEEGKPSIADADCDTVVLESEYARIVKLADDWSKELYTAKYGATLGRHYSEINEVLQDEHQKRLKAETDMAKDREFFNQLVVALCEIRDREPNGDWAKELAGIALQRDLKFMVQV